MPIVDSTNFTDLGDRFDENLHLVEHFSRIDPETYSLPNMLRAIRLQEATR